MYGFINTDMYFCAVFKKKEKLHGAMSFTLHLLQLKEECKFYKNHFSGF